MKNIEPPMINLKVHQVIKDKEKDSKNSIFTGMKGIGKSYYIEKMYKDFLKIETPNKNRQDDSIYHLILKEKKVNNKILLKTNPNYLKNKYNVSKIIESTRDINIVILLDDIGKQLTINKNKFNNTLSKFNLKESKFYKLINKF